MLLPLLLSFVLAEKADFPYRTDLDQVKVTKFPVRKNLDPVILIPGLGGSRVQFRDVGTEKWKTLWLDTKRAIPPFHIDWIKDMKVTYDVKNNAFNSASHVEVRPADYGGKDGVYCLDPLLCFATGYFDNLVDALIDTGYTFGTNLFGAPFDWRVAGPDQVLKNGVCRDLKALVEKAYGLTGKKVHLVGHSLGACLMHQFFTKFVDAAWKAKYIASGINVSPPFGGSFEGFAHSTGPHKWGNIPIPGSVIHQMTAEMGAIYWVMPNMRAFGPDYRLASIPALNTFITLRNISFVFTSTNRTVQQAAHERTQQGLASFEPPRVPTYLIYSTNVSTTRMMTYEGKANEWWLKDGKSTDGDGDGTVPIESLRCAEIWKTKQTEPFTVKAIPGPTHSKILGDETFVAYVRDIVSRD